MSALAGLSQQIISTPQSRASEKALSKSSANKSSSEFEKKFNDADSRKPKDRVPASNNSSVQNRKNSSPEKTLSEKRMEERVSDSRNDKSKSDNKKLTKQEAMWAFLDRMNQELGVQPEKVMNAFAKLDVDHLMAPPETSADEFVQNLDLQPGQEEKALNLYSQLLTWTSAASLSEQLQKQGQSADMAVMNSQEYQAQQRLAGLNELSDKFFMNGDHTRDSLLQSRQNMADFAGQGQGQFGAKGSELADNLMDMQAAEQKPTVGSTEELLNEMSSDTLTKVEESQLDIQKKLQALKSYGQTQNLSDQNAVAQPQPNTKAVNLESLSQIEDIVSPTTQAVDSKNMEAFAETGEGEQQMDMSGGDLAAQDTALNKTGKAQGSDFIVKAPQPTETEMSENIREIINKAQVMVKKGGGEMKLNLRPEGMGNVNLKVNVVGGDVRVEMITASDETRKALEKGLGDLKDNLSLQKLNVEQIKVESMQEAADKMMEQKQEQAERQFQERFLQDFKNQNQSRFGAMFGVNPVGQQDSQELEESESRAEARRNSDRKLDLVA